LGLRPIVFERGKDVRSRRRDIAKLTREHIVNPESNYCFGEGGAGTYSDGKLYTRSKKRGDVNRILQGLIQFGADKQIAIEAHPHIGTNKLPIILVEIREAIIACGGEVNFQKKLTDLKIEQNKISAIELNEGEWIPIDQLILATGHSARDIYYLLKDKNIQINAKAFALGVRVEHPQNLIDQMQYHCESRPDYLAAASYKLVEQVDGKGVYSFCMCPGGIIAPCATNPEEIVTNGWSPSKRNNPFANSGIVITIDEKDWQEFEEEGELAALKFQEKIESLAYQLVNESNNTQYAPAQRLLDFIAAKASKDLPKCSYTPGIISARVDQLFPTPIYQRLRKAFIRFGQKMKGYLHEDAIVVAVESRTSAPIMIPRDKENFRHNQLVNLYPCGEGAGYAGGIVSAAIDGVNVVSKTHQSLIKLKK